MAYTASTGFRYYGSISGMTTTPVPMLIRVGNSQTIRIGDLVRVNTGGFVVACATGEVVGGVCVGLTDENGINVLGQGITNDTGSTLTGDDTVATSATNQTRANYVQAAVIMDVVGDVLWLNDADADLAQSNLFQFFDVASGRQVTQGSASDANGQVQLVRLDPEATGGATANASKGLFRINENQFSRGVDSATAKNAA